MVLAQLVLNIRLYSDSKEHCFESHLIFLKLKNYHESHLPDPLPGKQGTAM